MDKDTRSQTSAKTVPIISSPSVVTKLIAMCFLPILMVSCGLTILSFFSQYGLIFDLASHFRVQYFVLQIIFIFTYLLLRDYRKLWMIAIFALFNLQAISPLLTPTNIRHESTLSPHLKLLLFNVHSSNTKHREVMDYIRTINPDIIALEEINGEWQNVLNEIDKEYPVAKSNPRDDNFGIVLLSKIPIKNLRIENLGSIQLPSIVGDIEFNGVSVTILMTHPVPPISKRYFQWRNQQLTDIALNRKMFNKQMIVIGDLNSTPWSYFFQDFVTKMNLRNSQDGFGLQISWPTMVPVMGIPIDHCLVSPGITVLNRYTGPFLGSDHYPLIVELGTQNIL